MGRLRLKAHRLAARRESRSACEDSAGASGDLSDAQLDEAARRIGAGEPLAELLAPAHDVPMPHPLLQGPHGNARAGHRRAERVTQIVEAMRLLELSGPERPAEAPLSRAGFDGDGVCRFPIFI